MANPLKLPFDFPPNSTPTTGQLEANFIALLKFVQDLNDGVTALTSLLVSTLQTTSTALIGGDLTSSTRIKLADGSISVPSLTFVNGTDRGVSLSGTGFALSSDTTTAMTVDGDQNINQPLQPAFLAFPSTTQTISEGGVPTQQKINYGTEIYDQAGNFNTSTSTFTAPKTGIYLFCITFVGGTPTGPMTPGPILITSNRNYPFAASINTTVGVSWFQSVLADMDSGDTAFVRCDVASTGADSFDIFSTTFSGTLVN